MPLILEDLRGLARAYLVRERPGHTLQPTALVNEAFLRLLGRRQVQLESRVQLWTPRGQTPQGLFFARRGELPGDPCLAVRRMQAIIASSCEAISR